MNKREPDFQFSARALAQIEDLARWLGEARVTSVLEAAISSAWQVESARQYGHVGRPWVVQPGSHHFASEADAIRWLKQQGAQPVGSGMWSTDDADGDPMIWELEPLRPAA